jgi:hypothetical protein
MGTAMHLDRLTIKESAHVQIEKTTCLKGMSASAPNMRLSGMANIVQDVPQEWTSTWNLEFATSALKGLSEATR